MPRHHSPISSCVEHPFPGGRRLTGTEAVVIIVVVVVAAVLVAFAGVPGLEVLWLLAGAGLVAGATITLSTRLSLPSLRAALKAALTAA